MSFVPPPPPGVVVPTPPAATPAVKVAKPGGVALDMSDLFGPPKTGVKKILPPWERKKKTPPPNAPKSVSDDPLAPPPPSLTGAASTTSPLPPGQTTQPCSADAAKKPVFKSTAEASYPSLSSPPSVQGGGTGASSPGPNAPVAVTCKSVPTSHLTASQPSPSSMPVASVMTSLPQPTGGTMATAAALPHVTLLPTVVPVPASASAGTASASVANPVSAQQAPASATPPQPPSASGPTAAAIAPAATAPSNPAVAVAQPAAAAPPMPGSDPAALAVTARIVEDALRDMRMHLVTPTQRVVAPHAVFQGREQKVEVMPLGPVPPKRKMGRSTAAKATGNTCVDSPESDTWHNVYDLQPSPSCHLAFRQGRFATTSVTGMHPAKREWHGAYFHNVDVHRYIARRYFGEAPLVEH